MGLTGFERPAGSEQGDVTRVVPPILRMSNITKRFPGVVALNNVSFECHRGEVHALVGENGAGKSTLIKILAGAYSPDDGRIYLDGSSIECRHPQEAQRHGLSVIYQEFNLLPYRTVSQNIFVGREPTRYGVIDSRELERRTSQLLSQLDVRDLISPAALVHSLSVAHQQIVEIAKALSFEARVLVMDEPTAALDAAEVEVLFDLVRRLQQRGIAVIYISHRLKEVFELADRITVLRDGHRVGTVASNDVAAADIIKMMVGREVKEYFPERAAPDEVGEVVLRVTNAGNRYLRNINLVLHAGEIVGLAGLQGSGRNDLAQAIFGEQPFTQGAIEVKGEAVHIRSPRHAIVKKIGFVTEDRKKEGIGRNQSIRNNILLAFRSMQRLLTFLSGDRSGGQPSVHDLAKKVDLRTTNFDQEVWHLSGGNQQKTVLAKWLGITADILILAEPTRGIDVNAKAAIYDLIRDYTKSGGAVLMISSELPEIVGMSDRILVMRDGAVTGELASGASEADIMSLAAHDFTSDAVSE